MQTGMHNEKYSIKGGEYLRIHCEQFREYKDENSYKNYVNSERSNLNLYKSLSENGTDWQFRVRQAIEESKQTTGRKVRNDAIVICSTVESVPISWPPEACKKYFIAKAEWFRQFLHDNAGVPEENLLSLCVHLDETTPHATYAWIPEKNGKLQAKNICTKVLYKHLQAQSQDFTFKWIDDYNKTHEEQLERLEPYKEGGIRKHLSEQEYKEKKIAEHVQQLETKHDEIVQKVSDAEQQHEVISNELMAAKDDLQRTKAENAETLVAGKLAEQKIQESKIREQDIERREKRITEITGSPSIAAYDQVRKENDSLKNEISLKDKLIESLQQTIDSWKLKIRHLGKRMASALGFREEEYAGGTQHVSEFPDRVVRESYENAVGIVNEIDPQKLRVIPDQEHKDNFALAVKEKTGKYKIYDGGFATRELADNRRRDLLTAKVELEKDYRKQLEKQMKIK